MLSPAQLQQRRNAGIALRDKCGRGHFVTIGKMASHMTWQEELQKSKEAEAAALAKSRPGRPSKS